MNGQSLGLNFLIYPSQIYFSQNIKIPTGSLEPTSRSVCSAKVECHQVVNPSLLQNMKHDRNGRTINYNGVILSLRLGLLLLNKSTASGARTWLPRFPTARGAAYIALMKAIHSLIQRVAFVGVRH